MFWNRKKVVGTMGSLSARRALSLSAQLAVEQLETRQLFAIVAGWDVSTMPGGTNNFGTSPLAATTLDTGVTGISLTRGAGVSTTGPAAARGWGGLGWNVVDSASAIAANKFATFGFTVGVGKEVDLSTIDHSYRRSGTGATTGLLQYQINAGSFTDITTLSYSSSSGSGATISGIDLSGVGALQNLSAGTAVTFRVVPYGASGATGTWYVYDTAVSAATDLTINGTVTNAGGSVPADPSGLGATTISSSQIDLAWTDNSGDETGFEIDRALDNAFTTGLTTITGIAADATSYSSTGLGAGTTYYYRVRAVNGSGPSGNSNTANATTSAGLPIAPGNLTVTGSTNTSVSLTWDDAGAETSYILEYTVVSNGTAAQFHGFTTVNLSPDIPGTTVTGLQPGVKYYFRVRANNAFGDGPDSAVVAGSTTSAALTTISFNGASTYTQDFDNLTTTNLDNTGLAIDPLATNTGIFSTGVDAVHDVVSSTFFSNQNAALNGWSFDQVGGTDLTPRFGATVPALVSGGAYSYGADTASDRAFGMNASGSNVVRIGASFVNTSGGTINSVTISFDAETWREGDQLSGNTMPFAFKLGAANISDGADNTWTALSNANMVRTGGGSASAVDGNTQKVTITADLSGLNWANGQALVIRWTDANDTGVDDGIAVDNFSMQLTPANAGIFSVATSARGREGGTASVTVFRSGGSTGTADVAYSIADLTTTSGDYSASGVVNFADGETSKTIDVSLAADGNDEVVEKFTVTLTGVSNTTAPNGALGFPLTSTVSIVDGDGAPINSGPFTQNWDLTGPDINATDGWDKVLDIAGYITAGNAEAMTPQSVLADQSNPNTISSGAVAEFEGNGYIAMQGSGTATRPQIVIDINTLSVNSAKLQFDAIDADSASDTVQPIRVYYRVGTSGAFTQFGIIADASDNGLSSGLTTAFNGYLPVAALGQQFVQIAIATENAANTDEFIGIDNINIQEVALPAWLNPTSAALWDGDAKDLAVTGVAEIIADPTTDAPDIIGTAAAADLLINPAVVGPVNLGTINLTGGASVTVQEHLTEPSIVLKTTGLTIDASSQLDLNTNDMIIAGGAASLGAVTSLLASGYNFGGWNGPGLISSSAIAAGNTGLGAITGQQFLDNDTLGAGTFSGVTVAATDLLIKYTYQGDANIDGSVDDADLFLFLPEYTGSQTGGWLAGDFTYDGLVDDADLFLFLPNYTGAATGL